MRKITLDFRFAKTFAPPVSVTLTHYQKLQSCLTWAAFLIGYVTHMNTKIFTAFIGLAIIATGCISTVSGTRTPAVPLEKDRVEGRYQRTVDQVYQAAVQVVQNNGVIVTEFIPHDSVNTVRSLQGKVGQCDIWMRVESVDPKITSVIVQVRTKWGNRDIDLAHELEKEIALQLAR